MEVVLTTEISFSNQFRDLFKRQCYEKYVFDILNKSNKLFYDKQFVKSSSEANGECDFTDKNGLKYDVKLLINTQQGELIGQKKNELELWINEMRKESSEFSDCIRQGGLTNIRNTKLYGIMYSVMGKFAPDENAILFCPFPLVNEIEGSVFLQFATDYLQAVYNQLKKENVVGTRETYFIYPSMQKNIFVLRNADSRAREYIDASELEEYFSFNTLID